MIIAKIVGGLGNQLFIYAFARSLSYNLKKELFLDVSTFRHNERRNHVVFGLNSFNIVGMIGNYPRAEKTVIGLNCEDEQDLTTYAEGDFPKTIYEYGVVKTIENIKLPAFFYGYYQTQIRDKKESLICENFFKDNINLIHEDFEYIKPLSHNSQVLIDEMDNYDSVALHIRHGDYENIPDFGFCSQEYYQTAIELLTHKLNNPKFYIFTEDPDWAKENLTFKTPYKIIIFNEGKNFVGRGYGELLKVLSCCKHFIIANSTFSWWGAFLSKNEDKIIISPKPWFQNRMNTGCDTIDNIKPIELDNNYRKIYDSSDEELFELNPDNVRYDNVDLSKKDDSLKLTNLNANSLLVLKNIGSCERYFGLIMKISLKSNCFNCLKIYYKTENTEYCEENSRSLYYYREDDFTHYLMVPSEEKITEILIKPHILENDVIEDTLVIESLKIKSLI